MSEQNHHGGLRKIVFNTFAVAALLPVPVVALGLFGSSGVPEAIAAEGGLDARSFAPMPGDKPLPRARKVTPSGEEDVEVKLRVWEFTDERVSKKK